VLIGRSSEQDRVLELVTAVGLGSSGSLLLHGEAGIGKTALLEFARASALGVTVVDVRGVESESQLPFAVLSALARPLRQHLPALMKRQRLALEAALALGPPVETDRLAVAAGTLELLSVAAEDVPLLLLIDDAHWVDEPSREAILFACRRLLAEGVGLLMASRDDEPRSLVGEGLPELALGPLSAEHATELLLIGHPDVAPTVAKQIQQQTAGNPLALLTVPELLTKDERRGHVPLSDPLRAGSAEAAFGRLTAELPENGRRAMLLACADGSGQLGPVARALEYLGLPAESLAPAESAGLITVTDGRVALRHPLVRSALYYGADPGERRMAHAALAAAYEGVDADRRAWHLAGATTGPDEQVAAALEAAAQRASQRHGYVAAVDGLARAAELSPDGDAAVRRLLAAARAADLAGLPDRTEALADAAAARTDDPLLRADLALLRARAARDSRPEAVMRSVERAAGAVASLDANRESALLVEGALAGLYVDSVRAAEFADRACEVSRKAGIDRAFAELVLARCLHAAGRPVDRSSAVVLPAVDDLEQAKAVLWLLGSNPVVDRAQLAVVDTIVVKAREVAALGLLPEALLVRATYLFYLGDWAGATADNHEAIGLAVAVGRPAIASEAYGNLARLHAFGGQEDACHEALAECVRLARIHGLAEDEDFAGVYLGELALSRGDPAEAIRRIEPTHAARTISRARAGLIEAYALVGRVDDAHRSLDALDRLVEGTASPSGRAFVPRLRGLLAQHPQEALAAFEEAVIAADTLGWPLETARTELLFGQRLRRDRRRLESRTHLARAAALFDRLGAHPWAERARAELEAAGERVRPHKLQIFDELTPREIQLARIVAQGLSNRQAAEHMFLSQKTVEAHLGAMYRKLGVRSRTELAARINQASLRTEP
jgi:DNA-binding CsgD family transcriptional regulator